MVLLRVDRGEFGFPNKPLSAVQCTRTMQRKLPLREQGVPKLAIRPSSMLTPTRFWEEER